MAKYIELISRSKDEKEKAALEQQAAEAELQLRSDILAGKKAVSEAKTAVEDAMGQIPLDSEDILVAQRSLALAEEDVKALEEVYSTLFEG